MTEKPSSLLAKNAEADTSSAAAATAEYVQRLYVNGQTPRSVLAIENMRRICAEHLSGRYTLEVIDIYERPEACQEQQFIAVPTVIKVLPLPLRRIIGDLSDTQKVLVGLDLRPAPTQREGSRTDRAHAAGLGLPTAEGHRGEIDDLRARVREVEETKKAIRGGEVDAVGRQFRGFLEASPDAVIVVDQTGLINFASNRIEAMFGYLPDELVGKPLSVLMPERYRDLHAGHLDRFMNDPRPRMMGAGLELRALRKDGSEFLFSVIASDFGRPLADLARHFTDGDLLVDARTVLSNLVPLSCEIEVENGAFYSCRILPYRTKDNRIQGVVITFVDVTAHKRAEDALNAAKV